MSNYYNIGTREDIVISNSSLTYINPLQGGNPKKFLTFFDDQVEKKISVNMERGTLLHDWHEHPDEFVVSDMVKPEGVMGQWADAVYALLAQSEGGFQNYNSDIVLLAKGSFYSNIKDPIKAKDNFDKNGKDYVESLFQANGKIIVTSKTGTILKSQIAALQAHKKANHMLFGNVSSTSERKKELEVYWQVDVEGLDVPLKFKAKLDDSIFDFKNKVVYLNDLKSTGKPVSLFKGSFISFRYYRQIAFYVNALFQYLLQLGEDPNEWTIVPRMVAVDNTPQFNVHTFTIAEEWVTQGQEECKNLISRVAWQIKNNEWVYTPDEVENKYDMYIDFTEKDKLFQDGEADI